MIFIDIDDDNDEVVVAKVKMTQIFNAIFLAILCCIYKKYIEEEGTNLVLLLPIDLLPLHMSR